MMGKVLGALVFVVGVAGLGYWGAKSHAVTMEAKIAGAAEAAVSGTVHPMAVTVAGRDITLTGTADTQAELDRVVGALDAITGRRVVNAGGVEVLPLIDPYETALAKGADEALAATGYAPRAALANVVAGARPLPLGHGAPGGWAEAMAAGADALAPLDEGSFALTGTTLTLSGIAATPVEDAAARAALGDQPGFDEVVALEVKDPGLVDFSLRYDAVQGYGLEGIVPADLGADGVAAALGRDGLDGSVQTTFAELPGLAAKLDALKGHASLLDRFRLDASNDGIALDGTALAGLDAGVVQSQIASALGDGVVLSVSAPTELPEDGATRFNAATGARQMAFGGSWMTIPDFEPTKPACTEAAMDAVAAQPILFLTGSAELDPVSLAAINDVAGIMHVCTQGPGMRVTVGGHTDAQGDDTENYSLSVARAKAVRDALIARGIAAEKVTAVGYGETEPVADNETEEGRARNRRTTFAWPD